MTFLLSVSDAAAALSVSDRWLWSQIRGGNLPSVRLGRRVLVRPEDVRAFIDTHSEQAGE